MSDIVKIGDKGKHVQIPEGWEKVTSGVCQAGDKYCDVQHFCFTDCEDDFDIGEPYDFFDCLIRRKPENSVIAALSFLRKHRND
jgi:hypothetical protein